VWWAVLFPSLAIATLIVGINLIADAIAQTFER
jgi:ABC-type dipeptide/oligopeptide/nickel transport system permease subunit